MHLTHDLSSCPDLDLWIDEYLKGVLNMTKHKKKDVDMAVADVEAKMKSPPFGRVEHSRVQEIMTAIHRGQTLSDFPDLDVIEKAELRAALSREEQSEWIPKFPVRQSARARTLRELDMLG